MKMMKMMIWNALMMGVMKMPRIEIKNVNRQCKVSFLSGYTLTLEVTSEGEIILWGDRGSVRFSIEQLCKTHLDRIFEIMQAESGNQCCRCKHWELIQPSKGMPQYHQGARLAGTCDLKGKQAPFDLMAYDSTCKHFDLASAGPESLEQTMKGSDPDGD
jgi:hypothetical protein